MLRLPRPFKTYDDFERAERGVRVGIERMLDRYYGRKPLNLEKIKAAAMTIPTDRQTEAGIPISVLLYTGAELLKDNPTELYNFYLTEIKPLQKV